tara:strand:+ start:1156 stop:1566 length:411 start_codon:yes stop_codon:yes gene_type:complete
MLNIISYLIKIIFSITITYFTINYYSKSSNKYLQNILSYNFIAVFLLSPIYTLSIENESLILFAAILLILFCVLFYNIKNKDNEVSLLYLLSLGIAILVSCGFILYSIICIAVLLYLLKYLIPVLNNETQDINEIE